MQGPVLISILSGLCGRALLGFPALAGQEYGAGTLVFATGVVSPLTPGEPERLSCIGQAQSVTPAPADELDRIGPAVLFKGQFPRWPLVKYQFVVACGTTFRNSYSWYHRLTHAPLSAY